MTCKFYYYRQGKCINEIPYDSDSSLCKIKSKFLCDNSLGEDDGDTQDDDNTKGGGMILSHSSKVAFIRCRRLLYYQKVLKLAVKPEMLALPVKLGAIWDEFIQSLYSGVKFKDRFWELVDKYSLDDTDVAKIFALMQAHRDLELTPVYETSDGGIFRGCQQKFEFVEDGDVTVIGYIDRAYSDHIVETKLTSRPDFYFQVHNISSQIGTYFLSNPDYKYCTVEAVRVPDVKTGSRKFSDESMDDYQRRVKGEILSKPSHYFPGLDRKAKTYGKRFWRGEFNLEELMHDYACVNEEINRCLEDGTINPFYKNRMSCYVPAACGFLPICDTGNVSESIFMQREPKQEKIETETEIEGGE